ncbi:MAG: hypothetical protein ACMUHU_03590 [Thermoplasmatota archaeon]
MDHRILTIILGMIMMISGSGLAMFADGSSADFDIEDVEVSFDPNPMNAGSRGKYVTVHIEFPADHDIEDIDVSSIRMDGVIQPEVPKGKTLKIGDHDDDDIPDIMLKFDRQAIIKHYGICKDKEVAFTGSIGDLTFEGSTKITIFDKGPKSKSSNLVYSMDFSSDPQWDTNNPSRYYWDSTTKTYRATMCGRSEEYARKTVPYNYGSFRFEYDLYIDSINSYSNFHLGLRSTSMSGYSNPDQAVEMMVQTGGNGVQAIAFYVTDKSLTTFYLYEYPTQSWKLDEWYHVVITYDAATATSICTMTLRSDGTIRFQKTITNIGGFDDLTCIAASKVGDSYASPSSMSTGAFDNVCFYDYS